MAIKYAKLHKKKYNELNLIVAHLGGGISLNIHEKGKNGVVLCLMKKGHFHQKDLRLPSKMLVDFMLFRKVYS